MANEVEKAQQRDITEKVLAKIQQFQSTGDLVLPNDYSPENAIKSAQLILSEMKDKNGKPVMEVCTKQSIAQSLLKMVTQGLSVAKGQCYFIPYGSNLNFQRSYQGSIALAVRVSDVKKVVAQCVYENDEFEIGVDLDTGYKKVLKHVPAFENIDNSKIKGAYAIVQLKDGESYAEIMTIQEIEQAWKQGSGYGKSSTHKDFAQEMAKKVVINRACKTPINSSSDAYLFGSDDEFEEKNIEKNEDFETIDVNFDEINESENVSIEETPKTEKPKEEKQPSAIKFPAE